MDTNLRPLILQAQQTEVGSQARQESLMVLSEAILSRRWLCRPLRGQPPAGIYGEVVVAAQQQLQEVLEEMIDSDSLWRSPPEEWIRSLNEQAFRAVLDHQRLQQLAIAAQHHPPRSAAWQYAMRELVDALRLSGKLGRPPGLSHDQYQDVLNRTLAIACQQLSGFDPQRGEFMPWINFRMGVVVREIQQEQQDSYTQAANGRVFRLKYELSALVKRVNETVIQNWLILHIKSWMVDINLWSYVTEILTVMAILGNLMRQNPVAGGALLMTMIQSTVIAAPRIAAIEETQLEAIAQVESTTQPIDLVRHYLETDPQGLGQNHIRNQPQATFQKIALSHLDGMMWKDLAEALGVSIPTLSTFYQRNLKAIAPHIRQFVEENLLD